MRAFAFLLIFSIATPAFAAIKLTDEQFDNISVLDKELRKKDSNFMGFSGTKDNLRVIGVSDEQATKDIAAINIAEKRKALKDSDPKNALIISGLGKIKTAAGLTTDETIVLIKTVIPNVSDADLAYYVLKEGE